MNLFSKPGPRLTAVLLVVLIVVGGIPFAVGGHINDLLHVPRPWQDVDDTGVDLLDAALGTASNVLDRVADDADGALQPLREEPQVPATFFHDIFDSNDRIGGWGDWAEDVSGHWHLDASGAGDRVEAGYTPSQQCAPEENLPGIPADSCADPGAAFVHRREGVERGYRFGDNAGFPASSGPMDLVSPTISLRSLPIEAPEERKEVPIYDHDQNLGVSEEGSVDAAHRVPGHATGGPTDPHRIILLIDHKYHLGLSTDSDGQVDISDSDRASVWIRPTGQGATPLSPLRMPQYGSGGALLSGAQPDFTEEAFDLTLWAGQDVQIIFRVETAGLAGQSPGPYFSSDRFEPEASFFGWAVSNVRIEGPAHMHNVRLDRVLYPLDPDGDGLYSARSGTDPVQVLLLNRGQVTERITARLDATWEDLNGSQRETTCTETRTMRPGDVVPVGFFDDASAPDDPQPCLDVVQGLEYAVTVSVNLDDSTDRDLFPADNERTFTVVGEGPDVRLAGGLQANPALADRGSQFTIQALLENRGIDSMEVQLSLRLDRQLPGQEGWTRDVQTNTSLVTFPPDSSPHQVLSMPGRSGPQFPQGVASWSFRLLEAGLYQVVVNATHPDGTPLVTEASTVVGILVAPPFAYSTDFGDMDLSDGETIVGDSAWTTESLMHTPPPCSEEGCPQTVWELPDSGFDQSASSVALRGEFGVDPEDAGVEIGALEVEFQHYILDLGCLAWRPAQRISTCDIPHNRPSNAQTMANRPEARPSVRLVENVVAGGNAPPAATQLDAYEIQHVGGSHYRNAFYNGQWLTERHTVSIQQLLNRPTVPTGRLADFAMEFLLENERTTCPSVSEEPACPIWRVARAHVVGIPAGGEDETPPVSMLSWSSVPESENRGEWYSYFYTTSPIIFDWTDPYCAESGADDRFRCPVWQQTDVTDLASMHAVAQPSWHQDSAKGSWTNSRPDARGIHMYNETEGGRIDLLKSPPFWVPDVDEPEVSFDHSFLLHPYRSGGPSVWHDSPSYADTGMLMLRFHDPSGEEPVTPFLPIYHSGATQVGDRGRFMGDDCRDHYRSLHPNHGQGCTSGLLARDPVQETLPLHDLPVLDYRDPAVKMGHRGGPGGYGNEGGDIGGSPGIPGALRNMDLTRCRPDGTPADAGEEDTVRCVVQFAFRIEVPDTSIPDPTLTDEVDDLADLKTLARTTLPDATDGGAEGWFLYSFQVLKGQSIDFDLQLVDAHVGTGYDWHALGLGPGTEAQATLTVRSNGFFPVKDAIFHVTVQHATDPTRTQRFEVEAPSDFVLNTGDQVPIVVPFTLPPEGFYRITFGADLLGDMIPGMPLQDFDGDNNCRFLQPDGTTVADTLGGCRISSAGAVEVAPNPRLGLVLAVDPEAGRTGEEFPRIVDVRIRNDGNVVVHDAELVLRTQPVSDSGVEPQVGRWIVRESPLPTQNASWMSLDLADPVDPAKDSPAEPRIVLEGSGKYFVTAALRPGTEARQAGEDWEVSDQVLLEAFDTIYSDTFDADGVDMDKPLLVTGSLAPQHEAWGLVRGEGITGETVRMWRFGDPETGRYPDGADAPLEMPAIDLSAAQRASLAITHKYDLEDSYDGARVEASLDDGTTWHPLTPRQKYPGLLSADTPLNPDHDPARQTPGFTGNSTDESPLTGGWVIDEFDLSQLPGFTTPVMLQRFTQDGLGGPHGSDSALVRSQDDERISFDPSWALPLGDCLDDCWYRENLNRLNPQPLDSTRDPSPDDAFWWSGSAVGTTAKRHPATRMSVEFPPPEVGEDQAARLVFWVWKDASGELEASFEDHPVKAVQAEATSGWVRRHLDLPVGKDADDLTVLFQYRDTVWDGLPHAGSRIDKPNRGAAVDGMQIEVYSVDSLGRETEPTVFPVEPDTVAIQYLIGEGSGPLDEVGTEEFCGFFEDICQRDADGEISGVALGWSEVPRAADTSEAWGVDTQQPTRLGELGPVWRFGLDHPDQEGKLTYPGNAWERLVTPRVSLKEVAGTSANLTYWERYDIMPHDVRAILVQSIEPTLDGDGEEVGDWMQIWSHENGGSRSHTQSRCSDDHFWCQVEVPLPESLIGKDIRFAFEIRTTRLVGDLAPQSDLGYAWLLDEVAVEAESMVGSPVRLRLRAATDGSLHDGHWMVENAQLVGFLYPTNVAVLPDEGLRNLDVAAAGGLDLSGLVRNLGADSPVENIYLDLSAQPLMAPDGSVGPPPTIRFLDASGYPLGEGPVGPIALDPAGAKDAAGSLLDRRPYRIQVDFPEDAPQEVRYRLDLRLLTKEAGDFTEWVDPNLGDHERSFFVTIRDTTELLPTLAVDPPTVNANETANITLDLDNPGTLALDASVTVTAERLDGSGTVTVVSGQRVGVPAGQSAKAQWNWTPEEPGFYRIVAAADAAEINPVTDVSHILVGRNPIYFFEAFGRDPYADEDPPNPPSDDAWIRSTPGCTAPSTDCWRWSQEFHHHGNGSLFLGSETPGGTYSTNADGAWARTPWADLAWLAPNPLEDIDIRMGESPFKPYLSLRYQPLLAGGDSVVVRAAHEEGPAGRDRLDATYRPLLTGDPLVDSDSRWRFASFPLFDAENSVLGNGEALLGNGNVSFGFRFDAAGGGQGFALDLATLSSYDMEVLPPRHDVTLQPGSNKTYYFRVENTGAARDLFQVRIDPDRTDPLFSSVADVSVMQQEIPLEAGDAGLVAVRVEIPLQPISVGLSGADIALEVASSVDPNRVAHGVIKVDEFLDTPLPNLVTELRRPAGQAGSVVEGEQATFLVSVTNEGGRTSRATDLVLFACPLGKTVEMCREDGDALELGAAHLPPLTKEGGRSTHTFSWVPTLDKRGDYLIVAVADPRGIVTQFDRSTSVATIPLTVDPIERPDLNVVDLRVVDGHGNNVTRAHAGDVLRIEGVLRNDGNTDAPNVRARIVNQFPLREERIGTLPPGGTTTLTAQWVAQPGNWVILFDVTTPVTEIRSDNDARRWSLAVRQGTLDAAWEPALLHLDRGQGAGAVLRLGNHRDHPVALSLEAPAGDVAVRGMPETLELARGAEIDVPVQVSASPFAQAGRHVLRFDAVQEGTGSVLATSALEVHVDAQRDVRFAHEPVLSPPGRTLLDLAFTNGGSSPEALPLRLTAPDGWTATPLQPTVYIDPGVRRSVHAVLDIPPGTPAGRYNVMVDAGDGLIRAEVPVHVTSQPVWRSEVQSVQSSHEDIQILLVVENLGNERAVPPIAAGDHATPYSIHPPATAHEPDQARTYRIVMRANEDGAASLVLPGHDAPVPLEARTGRPPVEALDLDAPAGSVQAGEAVGLRLRLRNAGDEPIQALPARLWIDGVLVDERLLDVGPGETRDVEFRWTARGGTHVVAATVGSGELVVTRAMLMDVAAQDVRVPGFAITGMTIALASAVLLRRRRDP